MISKELFLEIFKEEKNEKLIEIEIDDKGIAYGGTVVIGTFETFSPSSGSRTGWKPKGANIYEFAHKCKEWAKDKIDYLESGYINGAVCRAYNDMRDLKIFWADTEPEAIFKACQWILDNKDKS